MVSRRPRPNAEPDRPFPTFSKKTFGTAHSLLRQKALDTLRKLGWRACDTVYVVLDDTQQRKRGKKMDAVKKLFLHAEKVYAPAHIFVTCALVYRGVVIPYAVRLWLPKEFSRGEGIPFRKLTELAAEMLTQLALPGKGKVIALFDSYYLCPVVVRMCESRGWAYISVAKKTATSFRRAATGTNVN